MASSTANQTCTYCGEAFYAERSMQVFCSNLCDKKVDSAESGYESVSHRLRSANLAPPNAAAIACAKRCRCPSVLVLNAHHLIVATNSWLAWRQVGSLHRWFPGDHETVIPSCRLCACIRP